jgi:hypothetical protein
MSNACPSILTPVCPSRVRRLAWSLLSTRTSFTSCSQVRLYGNHNGICASGRMVCCPSPRQRSHDIARLVATRAVRALHDRILAKVARRVVDGEVLAMVKQFLKSTGDRGVPQGSPLSPLLANLALDDLDHALDRGGDTITYARYLEHRTV